MKIIQQKHDELILLAGFLRGLSGTQPFAFDDQERRALKRASQCLQAIAQMDRQPDPISQPLNEGQGTYNP